MTDSCELPCGCGELILGLLQEQVLLTASNLSRGSNTLFGNPSATGTHMVYTYTSKQDIHIHKIKKNNLKYLNSMSTKNVCIIWSCRLNVQAEV